MMQCTSKFNSPCLVVLKQSTPDKPKYCPVTDHRKLNAITKPIEWVLPRVEELMMSFSASKYISSFDLHSSFHQILLDEQTREKTAISLDGKKLCYKRVPFGLMNGPAALMHALNTVLSGLIGKDTWIYLYDILVISASLDEHTEVIQIIRETAAIQIKTWSR